MLDLLISGFLKEEPLHGYELKQRISMLASHFRPVSDGALYPAITRLEKLGYLKRSEAPGRIAAPRRMLTLTTPGEMALLERLRTPEEGDISDRNRFFTLLAFLKYLAPQEQKMVLERRLAFLKGGGSFFQNKGRPVYMKDEVDPFRHGMLHIASETTRVEKAWLVEMMARLENNQQ